MAESHGKTASAPARKLRVVSDGTPWGTQVLADGEPIEDVVRIEWRIDADSLAAVTVTLHKIPVDVIGEENNDAYQPTDGGSDD